MGKICSEPGCEKEFYARGLCENHYKMVRRNGDTTRRGGEPWQPWEVQRLTKIFAAYPHPQMIPWDEITPLFPKRTLSALRLEAHRLGLSTGHDRYKTKPKSCPQCDEEFYGPKQQSFCSQKCASAERWIRHEHPRGAIGHQHTPEQLDKISRASKRTWDSMSPEQREQQVAPMLAGLAEHKRQGPQETRHNRGNGGKRSDLGGQYFRSSWEANYARYLNFLVQQKAILRWEYEPRTFEFPVKRGTRFYTPDFLVYTTSGATEWHEVKGWMTQQSQTALKRFTKYYPAETLVLIDADVYRGIAATAAAFIPEWETKSKRSVTEVDDAAENMRGDR